MCALMLLECTFMQNLVNKLMSKGKIKKTDFMGFMLKAFSSFVVSV